MEINWTEIIVAVISLILVPMLTWGLAQLTAMLKAKTEAIKDESARAYVGHAIDQATDAVSLAVRETAQTFVDALKKEGKFDEAAAKAAFNQAYERTKQILGDAGQDMLADAVADVEAWLKARIEATVKGGVW